MLLIPVPSVQTSYLGTQIHLSLLCLKFIMKALGKKENDKGEDNYRQRHFFNVIRNILNMSPSEPNASDEGKSGCTYGQGGSRV